MKMTIKEINAAIKALPLLSYQQSAVEQLIENITGQTLKDPSVYHIGQRLTVNGEACMLACVGPWQLGIVNLGNGSKTGKSVTVYQWRQIPQDKINEIIKDTAYQFSKIKFE